MKKQIYKLILRSSKNPNRIFHTIKKLTAIVFGDKFSEAVVDERIREIEETLLLSGVCLNFTPEKDMHNKFIVQYLNAFYDDISSRYNHEDIINMFECSGQVSFQYCNDAERKTDAEKAMREYIVDRLMIYRIFAQDFFEYNKTNADALTYLFSNYYFQTYTFYIESLRKTLSNIYDNTGELPGVPVEEFSKFIDTLADLFNIVTLPKSKSLYPYQHTEGHLAYIAPSDTCISFSSTSGVGSIICKDCGHHESNVISFVHGAMEAMIGRQCPQCGCLCAEHNESKEYHKFGTPTEDFACPKCGYIIHKKDENIFKGNQNPIFCPKCYGTNLRYHTDYLT